MDSGFWPADPRKALRDESRTRYAHVEAFIIYDDHGRKITDHLKSLEEDDSAVKSSGFSDAWAKWTRSDADDKIHGFFEIAQYAYNWHVDNREPLEYVDQDGTVCAIIAEETGFLLEF